MALSIFDIITPQYLKDTFILGVDLTLDDGSPYPDEIYTSAIEQAVSMLELDLGINIDPFTVKEERHDADIIDRFHHWSLTLDQRPLIKVDSLGIKLGNEDTASLPLGWVTVASPLQSKVNLIPTSSTVGSIYFKSGVPLLVGDVFSPYDRFPLYFAVSYKAGFQFEEGTATIPQGEKSVKVQLNSTFASKPNADLTVDTANGGVGAKVRASGSDFIEISVSTAPSTGDMQISYSVNDVDHGILRAVGLLSAMLPLNIAGDLIAGAGIATQSISIDGLSQSVGTTSSATNSGYGARVIQFNKELKELMTTLRAKYKIIGFGAR
tara:strand:- start:5428 stop:6396 length:969 start_codon:yes stop_codon:yes gene_type:complete